MPNYRLHVWFKDCDGDHDDIIEIPDELSFESVDEDCTLNNLECLKGLEPYGKILNNPQKVISAKIIDINSITKDLSPVKK